MIVVWREGVPFIRCKPREFAPTDTPTNVLPLLLDLRRWGMSYGHIAEALDVDSERVRSWGSRQLVPRGEVYIALKNLHAAAARAIADARGQ